MKVVKTCIQIMKPGYKSIKTVFFIVFLDISGLSINVVRIQEFSALSKCFNCHINILHFLISALYL
jgi:hypothetical protein